MSYFEMIQLTAVGQFATPGVGYDCVRMEGQPCSCCAAELLLCSPERVSRLPRAVGAQWDSGRAALIGNASVYLHCVDADMMRRCSSVALLPLSAAAIRFEVGPVLTPSAHQSAPRGTELRTIRRRRDCKDTHVGWEARGGKHRSRWWGHCDRHSICRRLTADWLAQAPTQLRCCCDCSLACCSLRCPQIIAPLSDPPSACLLQLFPRRSGIERITSRTAGRTSECRSSTSVACASHDWPHSA